jgi:DNA primase
MARLSDDEVNKLKTQISLLRLVEAQGHAPKKQGKDYVISCPFHEEATPSLIISPKNNLFHSKK